MDWEDPGRFPKQGGPPDVKYATEDVRGRQVNLSADECANEGSGYGGGGDVRPPTPEY